MRAPSSNRWFVLAVLCLGRLCFGLQFQSLPPLSSFLMEALDLNYARLGLLVGIYMLPGVAVALPAGLLGNRYGDRATLVGGLGLMVLGNVLVATSGGFALALAGRVLAGTGGIMMVVQQTKVVTERFAGGNTATAMSLMLSAYPLGIALAAFVLGPLAEATSWQAALHATTALLAATLVLTAIGCRDLPSTDAGKGRTLRWSLSAQEARLAAVAGVAWMCLNAGFIVFLSFAPVLLLERGYSVTAMGVTVSMVSWAAIVSIPLGGRMVDRLQRPGLGIVVGTLGSAVCIVLFAFAGWPVLWALAYGIVIGTAPGAVMSLPGQVLAPENRNVGIGVMLTVYYAGMAALPPLAGRLQDATSAAPASLLFGALLMAGTAPAFGVFRLLQRRWATPPYPHPGTVPTDVAAAPAGAGEAWELTVTPAGRGTR